MGGPEKLAQRKAEGVLNARERIEYLVDPGSFIESGMFARGVRPEVRHKTPADGKVAGFARVDGREVGIVSNDFTVLGASSSVVNMKKIKHTKQVANRRGLPLVFLGESSGARMPDRMGASGRSIVAQDPAEYQRLRESPWVSALLGPCYGSSTWYAAMSDFVVMRKGAIMAIASPSVTSIAINKPIDPEELGGWKILTGVSGLVDLAVDSDEHALDAIRKFLSYMPGHHMEPPPEHPVPPGSAEACKKILSILPESRHQVYDVRKIIAAIADRDSCFELKARFGKAVATVLARLDGKSVGFIANNPMFKGGALDVDACNKVTGFLVLCDSFNVPVVFLVDVPGFLIGLEGEMRGAPGRVINWMNALTLVTVPRITVIMRKSYGQAYINMGGGKNADEVACWPTADLGFMDPAVSVNVLYGVKAEDDPERFERLKAEVERDTSAWALAELYEAQTVIDPRDTRDYLIRTLQVHRVRLRKGVGEHLLRNWPTSY
ncbi:MAG: methylmalonyl-CoA carboxyltransferase [Betaproteobacteria bacterium]|nr:methylmalonyl-CoA carboxyltransferase [Betaproteobacteria bacterium]MBI3937514.1 methylmalonyl-CoA carboxyltransferase [Betaproteobacteria bacterium]